VLKKVNLRSTIITALLAAILFCIPVYFYIRLANYTKSWLLYMGCFFFFAVMFASTIRENKNRGENESTVALVFVSHVTTIAGVFFSCLLCFLLLVLMVPGYLEPGMAGKVLINEPANTIIDKTQGMSFEIFMAATIINFSVGSFSGIILSFYTKRNQTKDSREPTPLHQAGKK
jgi:hypothetical protein